MQTPREINVLLATIYILCAMALGIIVFGKIDDVVKCSGIVRTRENVSSVRNVIAGKIKELNFHPGQKVLQGDVLYSLDTSEYDIQKENLVMNREYLELRIQGNNLLLKSFEAEKNLVPESDTVSYTKFESYLVELEKLTIRQSIAKQEYDKEVMAHELGRVRYNIQMKKKEYNLATTTLDAYKKSFSADLYAEKKDLEMQYEVIRQNLVQLENQFAYLIVKAPVDGYVQEVSSLNVGDYIGG